ncbi:hypothetical protein HYT55_05480 [Candidatus Woesearchaeota archaeon]|nr:hypothetical protein [Candidatus Woesearchaeota archaeon]
MDAAQEKRWKEMWRRDKRKVLGEIKKATARRDGMTLWEFSDLVDLAPQDAKELLNQLPNWGANIYSHDQRILTRQTIAVTKWTHEDPFLLETIQVMGEERTGLRLGIVSDTHYGSRTTDSGVVRAAYRYFAEQGIKNVLHAGNVLAGKSDKRYRQADRLTEDLEEQIELLKGQYPKIPGITTHFILGHADTTFEDSQINPGREINDARSDFQYLGVVETDLVFNPEGKKAFTIRLYNERPYYTYGVSYQAQKKLEAMAGGDKPNIWLYGGSQQLWHSRYQDVETFKLPGLQHQTLKMRDRAYCCNVGFLVLTVVPEDEKIWTYAETFPVWKRSIPRQKSEK